MTPREFIRALGLGRARISAEQLRAARSRILESYYAGAILRGELQIDPLVAFWACEDEHGDHTLPTVRRR